MAQSISVLMSLYKKEEPANLKASLDSILAQTLQPQEIVVILDGPITRDLQAVLDEVQARSSLLNVLPQATNQGLGVALAIGVQACANELIARMDTDDIAEPTRLQKQAAAFQKDPQLSICSSNIVEFAGSVTNITGHRRVPEHNAEIRQFSKQRNPFNHMAVMFKRSAVLAAGNYHPLTGFEDYYLWVRMLKQGDVAYNIQEDLVHARTGADMYARRGGAQYLLPGLRGRYRIYRAGLGNLLDFLKVALIHIVISLLPNKLRGMIYAKKLHA